MRTLLRLSLLLLLALAPTAWAQAPALQAYRSTPPTVRAPEQAQMAQPTDRPLALSRWSAITAHTAETVPRSAGASRLASYVYERSQGGDFENLGEATFTYDDQDRLVETIDDFKFLFFPRRTLRVTRAYNTDGTWASSTIDELGNGSYAPYRRELYAYEDGRLVNATDELYESGAYVPMQRTTFVYSNPYPFPTEYLFEYFENGTPSLTGRTTLTEEGGDVYRTYEDLTDDDFSFRYIYSSVALEGFGASYAAGSAPGTPFTSFIKFLALQFAYYTETINPNPPYPQYLRQVKEGGGWTDASRTTYTRSDGLVVEALNERLDGGAGEWENESRHQITYDSEGHVISNTVQRWIDGTWETYVDVSLTYDASGNVGQYLEEAYENGSLETTYRYTYSWEGNPVSAEEETTSHASPLALAGPNPFAGRTALRLSLGAPADVTLRVYDVLGRSVATLQEGPLPSGEHVVPFETRGLPAGLYVARARSGTWTATRTLTLVR